MAECVNNSEYKYISKPLRVFYLFTMPLGFFIIGFTLIYNFEDDDFLSKKMIIIIDIIIILQLIFFVYFVEKMMRIKVFKDKFIFPTGWIKPKSASNLLNFDDIVKVEIVKGQYVLIKRDGVRFSIPSLLNEEMIPILQSVLKEQWNQYFAPNNNSPVN